MKKLTLFLLSLFISFTTFFIISSPVLAVGWPPEVKPEQGKASGTVGAWNDLITVSIEFWNVGEIGGEEYGKATVDFGCKQKMVNDWKCAADEQPPVIGIFSGGPNGKIIIDEMKIIEGGDTIQLVNGNNFTSGKAIIKAEVENPEIFSKYDWDENSNNKESQAKKESKLEDSGVAFSDLFGQVEVNIPNEDGTYDEEKWDFAKLDGKTFPVGTHIKTSENSGGYISFADMTTFTLKPGSEIILSSPAAKDSQIKLLAGNLWINVKKMMKDGSMEIEMSQAVAGIKGTRFILNETGTESTIMVTEGTVNYTSKSTGRSVDVSKGESVTASSKGLSEKTTFDPIEEEKKWQEFTANSRKNQFTLFIDWLKSLFDMVKNLFI